MCVSKILRPSLCQFFSQFLTVFCYLCLPGNAGILCRGKSWNWEKNKWNSIVAKATLLVENFSSVTLQLYEIVPSNLLLGHFYSKEFCYCHFFTLKLKLPVYQIHPLTRLKTDVEFVTKVTILFCVKYFMAKFTSDY